MRNSACHFGQLAQRNHGEQIGGNKQWIDAGVIRRPEHRVNHANWPSRISIASESLSIRGSFSTSLEVIFAMARFSLLLAKCCRDELHGAQPIGTKWRRVFGCPPICMRQADAVAE